MPMKRLIVDIAHEEWERHRALLRDVHADRTVTDAERLMVLESDERTDRVVSLAKYRGQLNAALARDIETDSYLSDLGMRAGVYGLEAA